MSLSLTRLGNVLVTKKERRKRKRKRNRKKRKIIDDRQMSLDRNVWDLNRYDVEI